jgi:hypothetical protein
MKPILLLMLFATITSGHAEMLLAEKGKAKCIILVDPAATAPERQAAQELASTLQQITSAIFLVRTNTRAPARAILVGPGEAARRAFADVPFDALGAEELVIKTKGHRLLLAGGHPRGTLYAVSGFLQQQYGVRWWTPWARHIEAAHAAGRELGLRERPAFEYREPYWYPAFGRDWSWRNRCNGQRRGATEPRLHPPKDSFTLSIRSCRRETFRRAPEWFSLSANARPRAALPHEPNCAR